jgi:hypothetical protein
LRRIFVGVPSRTSPVARAALAIILLAAMLWIVYGNGVVGYDGMYALVWGDQALHLTSPQLKAPLAPTPHPLAIVAGAVCALFGDAGPALFEATIMLSFAMLGWFAFALGRQLYSLPVGFAFALILLTRRLLVAEALQASIDIPFLALVLCAAWLEAKRPRRGASVLAVLGLAGLLRPEAWLLAGIYAAYLMPGIRGSRRWQLASLAAAAPALWVLADLTLTGDPLFSLHGTQDLAAQLDRPRELDTALQTVPAYLKFILYEPLMWGGIVGALVALYALYERSLLPATLAALGLVAFVGLGPLGLPLLVRYLLVPAAMLALFCAVGLFGWLSLSRDAALRYAWAALALILGGVLIGSVPADSRRIRSTEQWNELYREIQGDLHQLVRAGPAQAAERKCVPPIYVPNYRVVPMLAYWLDRNPTSFSASEPLGNGLVLTPRSAKVAAALVLDPREQAPSLQPPAMFRVVAVNRSWKLSARC